jgi:phenylacetate-coenzyme A ligase PaaK-like adenylate-forming protein
MTALSIEAYFEEAGSRLRRYIPPAGQWTPVEQAVFGPLDFYRVEAAQAEAMQFAAIRYTFQRHYQLNPFYRGFCQERGVAPDDLRDPQDLEKIPLIPDRFFKGYPAGRDFAAWLGNVFTGELPRIHIRQAQPSFEQVLQAFNSAGLSITYSSGTGGRQTVIPRDRQTDNISAYVLAHAIIAMGYPFWQHDMSGYLLMPNPFKTDLHAGRVGKVFFDAIAQVQVAIDRQIPAHLIRMAMSDEKGLRPAVLRLFNRVSSLRMIDRIIRWLEQNHKTGRKFAMIGAPYLAWAVIDRLQKRGRSFDFSQSGAIVTGGGWKVFEGQRLPVDEFRRQAQATLGIQPKYCLDLYGMVESNGWMVHCQEGHYLHLPQTFVKGIALDGQLKPLGYGEWGRFAYLDGSALSFPGFIMTGDRVRMLEHCPACDRPGPVLDPEIQRLSGEELRGCGEEVRRMVTMDMGGARERPGL